MKDKFYITTPIYYPSNNFTIGNCYTTVICDAIARFNRSLGKDVFFLTGTDEHGEKIQNAAKKKNLSEFEYLNGKIADAKLLWNKLGISYDRFIRTTDEDHKKVAEGIFTELYKKGFIYKGEYIGKYCVPCESYWTESQLSDGNCPDCGRSVIEKHEEAYFFKLSQFQDKLLDLYTNNPDFLQPESRVNEMVNFIKQGLDDLCVTRTSINWGIRVPFDTKHVIYVWIDALTNYLTGIGYKSKNKKNFEKFWPADVHIMAKEIVRFHAIIWPAMLMALDIPLPKALVGHGWLIFNGGKLSKSKETGSNELIDPHALISLYSADALRYVLLKLPFGSDVNYSSENFLRIVNSDLANDYGNFISRTLTMLEKYFDGKVPSPSSDSQVDKNFKKVILNAIDVVGKTMKNYDCSKALTEILTVFQKGNKYIEETMPWLIAKDDSNRSRLATVIYTLLTAISIGTRLLSPFIPDSSLKVLQAFREENFHLNFENITDLSQVKPNTKIEKLSPLFPRLNIEEELEKQKSVVLEN